MQASFAGLFCVYISLFHAALTTKRYPNPIRQVAFVYIRVSFAGLFCVYVSFTLHLQRTGCPDLTRQVAAVPLLLLQFACHMCECKYIHVHTCTHLFVHATARSTSVVLLLHFVFHMCECKYIYVHTYTYNTHVFVHAMARSTSVALLLQFACHMCECKYICVHTYTYNTHLFVHNTARNERWGAGV